MSMTMTAKKEVKFSIRTFDLLKYRRILRRGLCQGVGEPKGKMCIEAAICNVLGMEHDDDPKCVDNDVRYFKISLNDCRWSSDTARANGLYELGLAQLGSKGVIRKGAFLRIMVREVFREVFKPILDPLSLKWDKETLGCYKEVCRKPTREALGRLRDLIPTDMRYTYFVRSSLLGLSDGGLVGPAVKIYAWDEARGKVVEWDALYNQLAAIALRVLKVLKSPGCRLLPKAIAIGPVIKE